MQVLALHNSYHGDTVGAMDCAAASAFNGRLQTPWYSGKGCFLMPPYLQLQQGRWRLQAPDWLQQQQQQAGGSGWSWGSRQEAFDLGSRSKYAERHAAKSPLLLCCCVVWQMLAGAPQTADALLVLRAPLTCLKSMLCWHASHINIMLCCMLLLPTTHLNAASAPHCLAIGLKQCSNTSPGLQQLYAQHITQQVEQHEAAQGVVLGALLMEPLLQGAGGMLLPDPLFQATLVQVRTAVQLSGPLVVLATGQQTAAEPAAAALAS
jgi:hypothetical protein